MKKVFISLLLCIIFFSCRKENNQPPVANKPQLLSKIFVADSAGQNKQPALEISYAGNQFNEVKQLNGDGTISVLINEFTFDNQQRVTGFTRGSGSFSNADVFKLIYANDKLVLVQVFRRIANTVLPNGKISLSYNGSTVTSTTFDSNEIETDKTVAEYDANGNIKKQQTFFQNIPDATTEFFSYDNHPNTIDKLIEDIGANKFLPASKNNPGVIVFTSGTGSADTQALTYEYNQQGLPAIRTTNDPLLGQLLFEYKDAL